MTTPGLGIREPNLHPSTGLRCETFKVRALSAPACIVGTGTQLSDQTSWTEVTLRRGGLANVMPVPATLCVTFVNNNATPAFDQELRFRVTGINQFGDSIVETTPLIVIPDPGGSPTQPFTTRIFLSKVFASVTKFEYMATNIDGVNDSISVGHFGINYTDNTPTATVGQWIGEDNYGVGTPLRVLEYDSVNDTSAGLTSAGQFEIVSGEMTRLNREIYHIDSWAVNAGSADAITMLENLVEPLGGEGLPAGIRVRFTIDDVGGTGSPAVNYPQGYVLGTILTVAPLALQIDSVINYTSGTPTDGWVRFEPWTVILPPFDSRPRVSGAVGTPEHNAGFVIGKNDSSLAWEGDSSKFAPKGQVTIGAGWSPFISVDDTSTGGAGNANTAAMAFGGGDDIEYCLRFSTSVQLAVGGDGASAYPDKFVHTV